MEKRLKLPTKADVEAYGVRLTRARGGGAFVDVERRDDGVHVLGAENVREITLAREALGTKGGEPIITQGSSVVVKS